MKKYYDNKLHSCDIDSNLDSNLESNAGNNQVNIKNMSKRIFCCLLVCMLVIMANTFASKADEDTVDTAALQESINEKQGEISQLSQEKAALEAGRTNVQRIINGLQANKQELANVVAELDSEVANLQANIDNYNALIDAKQIEIDETLAELEEARNVAEEQYESMKQRIRFMYERGDSAYLDMLMSSNSFSDMLNKADYIEALSAYDRRKLDEYCLVVEYTQLCQEQLEAEQEILQSAREAAEAEQENINTLIAEKEQQISAYEADISNKEAAIREYDEEIAAQNSVIATLEAQVAAEKAALAEANRRHYNGGVFAWPAPSYTRISDEYGWRMHPTLGIQKFHNGVDLAAPGGSPILAAYDGEVIAAAYSSSMGNYIMIDHGDNVYTIYMHASALYVSKGQTVTRGQKIAAVGTTGRSTGNHLHFGVRVNGEYVNPFNYL